MAELQDYTHTTEMALLLDVSHAGNSAQACQLADEFVRRLTGIPPGMMIDVSAGDLLLTRGVLTKIKQQIQRAGASIGIVYSAVPQTQQAALDEGLFVKEKFSTGWTPIRQALPLQAKASGATAPPAPKVKPSASTPQGSTVDLPDFAQLRAEAVVQQTFTENFPSDHISESFETELEERLDVVLETEQIPLPTERLEYSAPVMPQELDLSDAAIETLYLRQNLRSGQTVRFKGNIIIVGDVHAGSEITAGGDIVVWGELRGIAHAGAQGNYKAEVRAMKIEALQLRIADYIARRPDRIYYHKDGGEYGISPEVARVADAEIKIFKTTLLRG